MDKLAQTLIGISAIDRSSHDEYHEYLKDYLRIAGEQLMKQQLLEAKLEEVRKELKKLRYAINYNADRDWLANQIQNLEEKLDV